MTRQLSQGFSNFPLKTSKVDFQTCRLSSSSVVRLPYMRIEMLCGRTVMRGSPRIFLKVHATICSVCLLTTSSSLSSPSLYECLQHLRILDTF